MNVGAPTWPPTPPGAPLKPGPSSAFRLSVVPLTELTVPWMRCHAFSSTAPGSADGVWLAAAPAAESFWM